VHAALYLLLFPQLIAGPIIRYREIADQLPRRTVVLDDFAIGVRRFVVGLGKKMLIANIVAVPADRIFAMPPAELSPAHAWLGIVCYSLQIYFDFSGYSDMAIGLGRMFGFRFPENFRWPYVADTVQEFWRRWHITLSAWFRDYVYVPLGGNRGSRRRTYANLVAVFFLCGLWHGASWTFVVWGLFHGAFLVFERLGLAALIRRLPAPVRHAYLLLVVMVGWVFFRSDTLAQASTFLQALAGKAATAPTPFLVSWYLTPELWLALAAGAIGAMPIGPAAARWRERAVGDATRPAWAWGVAALSVVSLAVVLLLSVVQVAARTYNPFIYFRF
jgi:alginate O-acetyltransferase complex protein AlgI